MSNENNLPAKKSTGLVAKFAERIGVDASGLVATLKNTAFRQSDGKDVTDDQMKALLIVAEEYKLNPFKKEIYAFSSKGGIIPIVPIDGWLKIANETASYLGHELKYSDSMVTEGQSKPCFEWIEAVIFLKDKDRPVIVREYFDECYRNTAPWNQYPKRMLRHKAIMQGFRYALSASGIHDEDSAVDVIEREVSGEVLSKNNAATKTEEKLLVMSKKDDTDEAEKAKKGKEKEAEAFTEIMEAISNADNKDACDVAMDASNDSISNPVIKAQIKSAYNDKVKQLEKVDEQ